MNIGREVKTHEDVQIDREIHIPAPLPKTPVKREQPALVPIKK